MINGATLFYGLVIIIVCYLVVGLMAFLNVVIEEITKGRKGRKQK